MMKYDFLYILATTLVAMGGIIGLLSILIMIVDRTIIKYILPITGLCMVSFCIGMFIIKVLKGMKDWTGF